MKSKSLTQFPKKKPPIYICQQSPEIDASKNAYAGDVSDGGGDVSEHVGFSEDEGDITEDEVLFTKDLFQIGEYISACATDFDGAHNMVESAEAYPEERKVYHFLLTYVLNT